MSNLAIDTTKQTAEQIEAALVVLVGSVMRTVAGAAEASESKRQAVTDLLVNATLAGWNKAQVKELFTTNTDWPMQDGRPMSEKHAKSCSASGKAWASVDSNGFSKFICSETGVLKMIFDADKDKYVFFPRKAATPAAAKAETEQLQADAEKTEVQKEAVKANSARIRQTFAELCETIKAKLTPKEFDKIRAELNSYEETI